MSRAEHVEFVTMVGFRTVRTIKLEIVGEIDSSDVIFIDVIELVTDNRVISSESISLNFTENSSNWE